MPDTDVGFHELDKEAQREDNMETTAARMTKFNTLKGPENTIGFHFPTDPFTGAAEHS